MFPEQDQQSLSAIFQDFTVEITADGSPTARLKTHDDNQIRLESMHNSQGAASETVYIYTQPFNQFLKYYEQNTNHQKTTDLRLLVVGLGLGYIELNLLLKLYLKPYNVNTTPVILTSFEKKTELITHFKEAFSKPNSVSQIQSTNSQVLYDLILNQIIEKNNMIIEKNIFCNWINQIFSKVIPSIHWTFESELSTETKLTCRYQFVAFDAFSQKTDSPLWTEDFFDYFFQKICDQDCVFTTYAFTGLLKRALQKNGFTVLKRPGFKGKRDATLAVRGCFSSELNFFQNV